MTTDGQDSAPPSGETAPQEGESADQQTPRATRATGGKFALIVAVADVVAPVALYYLFRAMGFDELTSLLMSAIAPVVSFIVQAIGMRRVDVFALFIGTVVLLNILVALTTNDPRALLARDGWITGLAGLFFVATLWGKRPVVFSIARPLAEGRIGPPGMSWDEAWDVSPLFRRVWRVVTVIWGVGLLVDGAIRVLVAYTVPVDWAPGTNAVQYFVVYAIVQGISQVYLKRSGVMRLSGSTIRRQGTSAS